MSPLVSVSQDAEIASSFAYGELLAMTIYGGIVYEAKKIAVLFLLVLFILVAPLLAQERFNEEDFGNFVNAQMKNWEVPGAAVLIIKDGKVILCEGYGYRDIKNNGAVAKCHSKALAEESQFWKWLKI